MMVLAVILYLSLGLIIASPRLLGLTLISLAVIFSYFEIFWGISGRDHEDKAYIKNKNCHLGSEEALKLGFVFSAQECINVVRAFRKVSLLTNCKVNVIK